MHSKLKTAALSAGLVGLIGLDSVAHTKTSHSYSPSVAVSSQTEKKVTYFLKDFGPEDEKQYKVNLGKVIRDLKGIGLAFSEPKLVFFRSREDLGREPSSELIYVVGGLSNKNFKNGTANYTLETVLDNLADNRISNKVSYELDTLIISDELIRAEENKDMAIYKSLFYLLSTHPLMTNAMRGIEADVSKYSTVESFIAARDASTADAQWLNHQVTTSLYQGILMEKGIKMGFKKNAIIKELKEHDGEGLMRNECANPSIRSSLFIDYISNPAGVFKKFEALEKAREERLNKKRQPSAD